MFLNRFLNDRRGSPAVEFAFIAPVVIMLYFGMVEATQALLVERRTGYIATAVGDLATQSAQLRESDIDDIFKISATVMRPFPTDELGIRLTSVRFDNNGVPSVVWTRKNQADIPDMDLGSIDQKLRIPNTALVRAETLYSYKTPFQKMLPGLFVFKHKMDLRPRSGVAIPLLS